MAMDTVCGFGHMGFDRADDARSDIQGMDEIWPVHGHLHHDTLNHVHCFLWHVHAHGPGDASVWQGCDGAEAGLDCAKLPDSQHQAAAEKFGETFLMIDFLKDLWDFMRERKKFWLAPIIVVMLLLGVLIVVAQGSAVAPFIYTLF